MVLCAMLVIVWDMIDEEQSCLIHYSIGNKIPTI